MSVRLHAKHGLILKHPRTSCVQELFDAADINKDGYLQLDELRNILRSASKQYSHLEEHAKFLDK